VGDLGGDYGATSLPGIALGAAGFLTLVIAWLSWLGDLR